MNRNSLVSLKYFSIKIYANRSFAKNKSIYHLKYMMRSYFYLQVHVIFTRYILRLLYLRCVSYFRMTKPLTINILLYMCGHQGQEGRMLILKNVHFKTICLTNYDLYMRIHARTQMLFALNITGVIQFCFTLIIKM